MGAAGPGQNGSAAIVKALWRGDPARIIYSVAWLLLP